MNDELTPETALLEKYPGTRESVKKMPAFLDWCNNLPVVEVDNETFYVVGGDQLKDLDQIIVAWINQFQPNFFREFENE